MTFNFLVAPDFAPERFGGWHMLNILLQRRAAIGLHLLTPASAQEQAALLAAGKVDLIYANPFDAADLIRTQGFMPIARPAHRFDEMVIATGADAAHQQVEDLAPGCRIALTENKDVKLIGLRLLEPADLTEALIEWVPVDSYQAAARRVIKGEVDAAFFLADAYASLTRLTRSQMRVLVQSAIHDISHVVLVHPRMAGHLAVLTQALLELGQEPADQDVLDALGMPDGFEPMGQEEAEFMIDLMDTLVD